MSSAALFLLLALSAEAGEVPRAALAVYRGVDLGTAAVHFREPELPPLFAAVMRQDAAASALVVAERNQRVTALAAQLQYQGATDPSTLENSVSSRPKSTEMRVP